jgi:hypothetical protein
MKNYFFFFIFLSLFIYSCQRKLTKRSFYLDIPKQKFPENYKELISQRCGWKAVGAYIFINDSIDQAEEKGSGISHFGPYYHNDSSYTTIDADSIYTFYYGTYSHISKIIHVDRKNLIIESYYNLTPVNSTLPERITKIRVRYRHNRCRMY